MLMSSSWESSLASLSLEFTPPFLLGYLGEGKYTQIRTRK